MTKKIAAFFSLWALLAYSYSAFASTLSAAEASAARRSLRVADCSDLFFSEYVDGYSFNKALEIYNPTSSSVNLSDYTILQSLDGGALNAVFALSGTLAAGDVFVLANDQADSLLRLKADSVTSFLSFNGNDAIALLHGSDTIDIIGVLGEDSVWQVGIGATRSHTLIRNYYTYSGNSDWASAAREWDVYPLNFFDSLGVHHTAPCGTPLPLPTATVRFMSTSATVAEENVTIAVVVETINSGSQNANFVVARDDVASTATAGLDYEFTNQTLSRGTGTFYDTVNILIFDDNLIESSETVVLRFINTSANVQVLPDSLYTLTITDSDVLSVGFVGAGYSYPEDSTPVLVRMALSTPAADTVTVWVSLSAGNATQGDDFIFNDTLVTFLPNSADTQGVWISLIDDNLPEENEQINLDLSRPTGGAVLGISAFTLTIVDNDTVVGVNAPEWEQQLSVYPNPAKQVVHVQTQQPVEAVIRGLLGQTVLSLGQLAAGTHAIDLSALPSGMYFLCLHDGQTSVIRQLLKVE